MGNEKAFLSEKEIKEIREILKRECTKADGKHYYSENEAEKFVKKCEKYRLNPLMDECYPMIRWNSKTGCYSINFMASQESMLKIAHSTGECTGIRTELIFDSKGNVHGAKGFVGRKGSSYESHVLFKEYNTGKSTWSSIGPTMIQKVARVQAMRYAFPMEMGGIYIPEEMAQADQSKPSQEPKINIADLNKRASDLKKLALEKGIDIKNGFAPDLLDEINTAFKIKDRSKIEPLLMALEQKINAYSPPPPKDSLETVIVMAEGQGIPRDVFIDTFKKEIDDYKTAIQETNIQETERIIDLLIEEVRDYNKPLKNQEEKAK